MLSSPNVNDLMPKAGSRYETVLAIAKRARVIATKRLERGDLNVKDAVDLASKEINEEKALVKIDGEYVKKEEVLDVTLTEAVDDILKDLEGHIEEVIEEPKVKKRGRKPRKKLEDDAKECATGDKINE